MPRFLTAVLLLVVALSTGWFLWQRQRPPPLAPAAAVEAREAATSGDLESEPLDSTSAPSRAQESMAGSLPDLTAATAGLGHLVIECVARSDRRPLAGVKVGVSPAEPGQWTADTAPRGLFGEPIVSGADGRVEFAVEPDFDLGIDAEASTYELPELSQRVPALTAGETRVLRLEFDVDLDARFHGIVAARDDGAPIAGAEVHVKGELRATSDDAGRFELPYNSHAPTAVRIDARGFGPTIVAAGQAHDSTQRARRILLERAAGLDLVIKSSAGSTELRATLHAAGHDLSQEAVFAANFRAPDLEWTAAPGAQGVCSFEQLPPGVALSAEVGTPTGVLARRSEPIVLSPGERRRVEWDLSGCELGGRVLEADGRPAPGVSLWLLPVESDVLQYVTSLDELEVVGRTESDADGRFRFPSVQPGTWVLTPEPDRMPTATPAARTAATPANAIASAPIVITVRAGESHQTVDVRLARGLFLCGRLVEPDGETAEEGTIFASDTRGVRLHTTTNGKGSFTLGPVGPGTFTLVGVPYGEFVNSVPVEAQAGARDIVLRTRPGATLAGTVVDPATGAGIQAAITVGADRDMAEGGWTMTRTGADGTFRFEGLVPGRYSVVASTTSGRAGVLEGVVAAAGAPVEGLRVVLEPGARLRLRSEILDSGEFRVRRNGAFLAGDELAAGKTATVVVPIGKLEVEFRTRDERTPDVRTIELRAGEEREIVFQAGPK